MTSECADGQDEGRSSVCKGLDVHIYGGGGDLGAQPLRFMFEAFSGSSSGRGSLCDNTWLDDIIISKATKMAPPTDPVCPPESPVASFNAFKFNLDPADDKTGLRGWDCCVQVAEISLYDQSGAFSPCSRDGHTIPAKDIDTGTAPAGSTWVCGLPPASLHCAEFLYSKH